ncbi:uncharacterized protein CBL_20420 [Carabus blaptoides fortunei]
MDSSRLSDNPNPRDTANPVSVLFFWYTIGMFRKGYTKVLEISDLYNPLKCDRSTTLGNRLESDWKRHLERCKTKNIKPSFLKTLVRTFWLEYLKLGILLSVNDIPVRLAQPLMLGKLLEYFRQDSVMPKEEALIYAAVIVALNGVSALCINQYIMGAFHNGMKVRAACCALIYRKALKLSRSALGDTASGKVVNLLSNDVSRFDIVSIFLHHMWAAPTISIIVAYFLWVEAGYAGLVGIATVFVVVPLQGYTGKLSSIFRLQTAYRTDERVRLMDEIISGVQVIKMYAWEKPFAKLIQQARKLELKIITKTSYVRGLYMTFNMFTTRVALFAGLLTMVLLGQEVSATKVFVFASYFNLLAQSMSSMFVRGISEVAEVLVAIKRLQNFLLSDEFEDKQLLDNNNINNDDKKDTYSLRLDNLSAKWNEASSEPTLSNVNLTVEKGKLIGIIGPVGAGKSSLLQAILGELQPDAGNVVINGKLSYASQEPWVFAASVRQNILFGLEYDKQRYQRVIKACALEKDFKQFPFADQTIVGDRGASLSGGQKARINLARAVYRQADIFLLDDPLSAVDTHVAKHLYDECINGYLGNRTRILITHQIQHLKDADHIIILNNGKVDVEGSYHALANSDDLYAQLLTEEQEQPEDEKIIARNAVKTMRQQSVRSKSSSITSTLSDSMSSLGESQEKKLHDAKQEFEEQTSKGKVHGSLSLRYLLGGGNLCTVMFVIVMYLLAQTAASGADYWVSYWTKQEELQRLFSNNETRDEFSEPKFSTDVCLYIYGGIIIALFVIALTRSISFYRLAMASSQNLHDKMFHSVIYTNMRFFNTNPSGRILNRFSKDIGAMDELLPKAILDSAQILLAMCGALILTMTVNAYFLIPVFVIGIIFLLLRVVFLKTSKNVKRLEGITRSPVFTHLNATLQGLTTIRAYGAQDILQDEFDKHQDLHTSAWYMFIASSCAFGFYLDLLCFVFTALVTFSFMLTDEDTFGGQVGLAITQSTALTGLVQWGIRQSAEVANQLMSVERVLEYTELPEEQQPAIPKQPTTDWPRAGRITFKQCGMRYADSEPLVLRDLNLTIDPCEKVGIVGRTGAGKSSLISALFRLAEVEGAIDIDEIDTNVLELQYLRSKISIIPQDPVLFSGTLRRNLDPFEEYPDEVLWRALEEVELKDVAASGNKLETRVQDRGSNFSVGQRQLVCLARAIIRNNKILMLDEATANVDPQTDALIQKTIRQKFAKCTVLTVAHRLNTIMDSDKVLVMESGSMVEFDHPHVLLQKLRGVFTKMVAETGNPMADQLKKIARDNYLQKHQVPEEE